MKILRETESENCQNNIIRISLGETQLRYYPGNSEYLGLQRERERHQPLENRIKQFIRKVRKEEKEEEGDFEDMTVVNKRIRNK